MLHRQFSKKMQAKIITKQKIVIQKKKKIQQGTFELMKAFNIQVEVILDLSTQMLQPEFFPVQ